jgi:hypothetical protein
LTVVQYQQGNEVDEELSSLRQDNLVLRNEKTSLEEKLMEQAVKMNEREALTARSNEILYQKIHRAYVLALALPYPLKGHGRFRLAASAIFEFL